MILPCLSPPIFYLKVLSRRQIIGLITGKGDTIGYERKFKSVCLIIPYILYVLASEASPLSRTSHVLDHDVQ